MPGIPPTETGVRPPSQRTVVINVVGLSAHLLGEHTPRLCAWRDQGAAIGSIGPVLPAVTTTAQTTYVTGKYPSEHGIVGNGWYFRDEAEVHFWKQSNKLVQAPKVWDIAKQIDPNFTCAKLFWWYNMYSTTDYSITPRPMYPSDGRKIPDVYSNPANLRTDLQNELGDFPLFKFWGPMTSIASSEWIANSAKRIEQLYSPSLSLVYLPHLDYCLQKVGPYPDKIATDLNEIDQVVGDLIEFYEEHGVRVMIVSEYGIGSATKPIHLNRLFRANGLIDVRKELGLELLDCGACKAFAVADHQIAHIYINDTTCYGKVLEILRNVPEIDLVLEQDGKQVHHIDHERAGDIVCVAKPDAWFTYYYWEDDDVAPDFARTVNIHRKPGYDPVEMFLDPEISFPMMKAGFRLMQKNLGFRYLMDLTPLDATLVQGSHGCLTKDPARGAILMTKQTEFLPEDKHIEPTQVFDLILQHLGLA